MLTTMVVINALCLLAVAVLAARLWRAPATPDMAVPFAAVLEGVRATGADAKAVDEREAPGTAPERPAATPPSSEKDADERLVATLALSARLAIVRHMLQGKSVEETAVAAGVARAAARALYRVHGRREGDVCS